ncbi:MAG: hypothetical protein QXT71_05690 [Thermoplasmata archaeon]
MSNLIYHIMLKIIYCDTINYIEKHLYDNTLFILPDSISLRNIEIYILRKKKHEYFHIQTTMATKHLNIFQNIPIR